MYRFMDDCNIKIIFPRFVVLLFLLVFSLVFVSTGNAYYGLSGLGSYGGLYGGLGLYGLGGGLYGFGLYGQGGIYGGLSGLYGLGGLYGLSRLYGLGGLYGLGSLYGLSGLYGISGLYSLGNLGLYGGPYGLGSLENFYGPNGAPGLYGLSSLYGLNNINSLGFSFPGLRFPGDLITTNLNNPLFAAEQAGAWTGTWNLGFLTGTMIMNLQESIAGSLSGTAQLIGNLTFGGIFNVYGSSDPIFISLIGQDPTLTYAVTLQGTLTTPSTMEGFYSIYKIGATVPKETGTFNLELLI